MRAKSGVEILRRGGDRLLCLWTRPYAERPRFPAVLFLHGFPGAEKNVDVQRALLAKGVASLALHFRGAWGSSGVYRFSRLVDDARAAFGLLRRLPGVDPRRLGVFGFSMGGWTALHVAARERPRAAVVVAPVGGTEMLRPGTREHLARLGRPLRVPSASALYRDFCRALARWDPYRSAAEIRCPLLLAHGLKDETVPCAVSERLFAGARGDKKLVLVPGAFHDFLERRDFLVRTTAGWLARRLL